MYGCLGFSSSRFYAKPLASLITKKGRDTLQASVETVKNMNFEVIYGDTDSILIDPKKSDLSELLKAGQEITTAITKKYKHLVLAIDGVFKNMLLLKKKKYACLKLENLD